MQQEYIYATIVRRAFDPGCAQQVCHDCPALAVKYCSLTGNWETNIPRLRGLKRPIESEAQFVESPKTANLEILSLMHLLLS
jgi:hypothetical protein